MVRTYIRKGRGHGGDSSKTGLPAGYWQEKGGRAAAAAAKAAAKSSKSERIARGRGSKGGGHQPLKAVDQAQ